MAALALAGACSAQDAASDSALAAPKPRWTLQFEPAAWYVAPSGKMRMPSQTVQSKTIEASDLNLDSPRLSPAGELHWRPSDRWRFSASAAYFSIDNRDATVNYTGSVGDINFISGDTLRSELDFFTAEISAAYALVPEHAVKNDADLLFGLDLVAGVRMYSVDWTVEKVGANSDSDDPFFAEPILGVKADATLSEKFTIDLQTTVGYLPAGDTESVSWDIIVGFTYRPVDWMGVQIGYRNLFFNLTDGSDASEFSWRGALAGLYGGIELRF